MARDTKTVTKGNEVSYAAPEGYEDISDDAKGTWDFDRGPIHFIPRFARAVDSKLESQKPSVLVIGDLLNACPALDKDKNQITLAAGEKVLVWVRPGFRKFLNFCGSAVFIVRDPSLDVEMKDGRNPMKGFKVLVKPNTEKRIVPLTEDYRDKSLGTELPWDKLSEKAKKKLIDEDMDDIPF